MSRMVQLGRASASRWTAATRDDGGRCKTTSEGITLPQAPRSLGGAWNPKQGLSSCAGNSRQKVHRREGGHFALPLPTREEKKLSNPWGTRDPHPPAGWSTAAHEDPSRVRLPQLQRLTSSPLFSLPASKSNGDQGGRIIIPSIDNPESMKRRRDRPISESELLERLWHQDQPSRRRRQCETGSSYVSPSQPPLPEISAEEELDFRRPWPLLRLTFRAGMIMRAVSRSGVAAKRSMPRSTVISRRRRRELDDALVQRAYEATHPTAPKGEAGGEDEQDPRLYDEALRVKKEKDDKKEAFWRRLRRVEEEREQQFEEELASRRKNLERRRAEANAEVKDPLAAKEYLIASAITALEAAPGPDMTTPRSLFSDTEDPRTILKDDRVVQQLRRRFLEIEGVLTGMKEAQAAGERSQLGNFLFAAGRSRLQHQPEFVSARQALRSVKRRAKKAAEDQAARD